MNRGFLNGPVCPIYGFGGVFVIVLLTPVDENLFVLYIASVLVTSILELVAGYLMKKLFHTSWWDYSDQPFNIGGYVCLKFSLLWGVACIFLMKGIHPAVSGLVDLIPRAVGWTILGIGFGLLIADLAVTLVEVKKLNRDLGEIQKLADGLRKGSTKIAEGLGDSAIMVAEKLDELDLDGKLNEKLKQGKDSVADSLNKGREKISEAKQTILDYTTGTAGQESPSDEESKARLHSLAHQRRPIRERLLNAYPKMKNLRYTDAIDHLRSARKKKDD